MFGGGDMSYTIQVRIDDDLKTQATEVFDRLGLDFSTAIRIFLKKSVAVNGIPFELRNETPTEAAAAVENMRASAEENDIADLTLDKINGIINKVREIRKK
jgi:DNA-damage-inducible protein J